MPHKQYNVRAGDTLTGIARLIDVKYEMLLEINPQITNPNLINIGDTILLPETVSRDDLLIRSANEVFVDPNEPTWLKIARRELGTAEYRNGSNPRILEYLATTTLPRSARATDNTSWCAAFVNWCLEKAGIPGADTAWALSWADFGKNASQPSLGAITVFSRVSASESGGHVGFFLRDLGNQIEIIGGNQGNSVSISSYPKNGKKGSFKYTFKAYRLP